eukprot:2393260-Alexandrium_andersonii.AAC.1
MSASLVGSEMCIRDRNQRSPEVFRSEAGDARWTPPECWPAIDGLQPAPCLLYTSDAADDM